jgi:GntR family transcriptional regulator
VIPFSVQFRAGISLFEQIVYASKKAMITGQLCPGDPFPSVRTLSKELKINPNTAHKVVAYLVNEGLLPDSSRKERTELLGHEVEELVVNARRMGIELDEMLSCVTAHWNRLGGGSADSDAATQKPKDGDRKDR